MTDTRTGEDLKRGLLDVFYELETMSLAVRRLTSEQLKPNDEFDQVTSNVYLEAFLIHARCLISFFNTDRPYPTDMRPTDFAVKWTPEPAESFEIMTDAEIMSDINKHLAHLTWDRVTNGKQTWTAVSLYQAIYDVTWSWFVYVASANDDLIGTIDSNMNALVGQLNEEPLVLPPAWWDGAAS